MIIYGNRFQNGQNVRFKTFLFFSNKNNLTRDRNGQLNNQKYLSRYFLILSRYLVDQHFDSLPSLESKYTVDRFCKNFNNRSYYCIYFSGSCSSLGDGSTLVALS